MKEPTSVSVPGGGRAPAAVRIREMTAADCEGVAGIRVRGRQHAYRGMMPQAYLDGLSVEEDAERRRAHLSRADGRVVNLVAEDAGGALAGWACHGPYRDGDTLAGDAELYALYVHPSRLGRGTGRALLSASVARCAAAGHGRMFLWVLEENRRARRFYERAGFRADGAAESFEVDGVAVPEVRYVRPLPR
ncbi:GNAT family N-acetyltransferase [Streptomyces sp. NPDC017943]|uniref:GNAT family N-acetyltransferase n=1 Tax=Streptomyces sp. NPDC017943 TaxID=3365019 RepID=UPI0037ADE643